MPAFLPDTSVMIAAVCSWHEHHAPAIAEIENRLANGERMVLAAHALIEAYSVLTRLPPPNRIAPAEAHAVLSASFIGRRRVIGLEASATAALLSSLAHDGVAGGRTYDALIAACARAGKISTLLTLNGAHFEPFGGGGLEIFVPGVSPDR